MLKIETRLLTCHILFIFKRKQTDFSICNSENPASVHISLYSSPNAAGLRYKPDYRFKPKPLTDWKRTAQKIDE